MHKQLKPRASLFLENWMFVFQILDLINIEQITFSGGRVFSHEVVPVFIYFATRFYLFSFKTRKQIKNSDRCPIEDVHIYINVCPGN